MAKGSIKTTVYDRFRGVDFTTDPTLVDGSRSPAALNLMAQVDGRPEKRPGWRALHSFGGAVHNIFSFRTDGTELLLVHAGDKLYKWDGTTATELFSGLGSQSAGVYLGGKFYILAGEYLVFDGETASRVVDSAYIPTTVIAREPAGGGTSYENINMVSSWRKNSFQTDGVAKTFYLDTEFLDMEYTLTQAIAAGTTVKAYSILSSASKYYGFVASRDYAVGEILSIDGENAKVYCGDEEEDLVPVTYQDENITTLGTETEKMTVKAEVWGKERTEGTHFSVDRVTGKLTFEDDYIPAAPAAGSEDGLVVTFSKTVREYQKRIRSCTIMAPYGVGTSDRVVLSGNPDLPNQDWMSGYNDPSYIPDLNYAVVGIESVPIMGYARVGEYQAIIKGNNGQDSTVFFRSAAFDEKGEAIFTLKQAVAGVGAVARGSFQQLEDEPLFLSNTGIYGLTTNVVTSERICQNRSFYVNGRLTWEPGLERARSVTWRGMYLLSVNGHVYVLDGRQQKQYRSESLSDYVYECWYWEGIPAACWLNRIEGAEETLYFGTEDGRLCRMNTDLDGVERYADDGGAITAMWSTKADDDGDATVLKTMIKKGCAVTLKPFIRSSGIVCFRTDRDVTAYQAAAADIFDWESIDFSRFTFDANDGPREIMFNTKVKKYKRLQIVIKNDAVNEGFGIYAITKHYVAGNFAKR